MDTRSEYEEEELLEDFEEEFQEEQEAEVLEEDPEPRPETEEAAAEEPEGPSFPWRRSEPAPKQAQGKHGPRTGPRPTSASAAKTGASAAWDNSQKRPRGNLPQAPSFNGDRKADPRCFRKWANKVDSYVAIAEKIIDSGEIGLRLHAALEGEAADYLEDIPAKTFGESDGWRVLVRILRDKFDQTKQTKVGQAMKNFFQLAVLTRRGEGSDHEGRDRPHGPGIAAMPRLWLGHPGRGDVSLLLPAHGCEHGAAGQPVAAHRGPVRLVPDEEGGRAPSTHHENRQKLAKAVQARGYFVKGRGKSKGKGKKGEKGSSKGKSKGGGKKGGKARGMSLEELKAQTACAECGQVGHWKDECPHRKSHVTGTEVKQETEDYEEEYSYDYDYDEQYYQEWSPETWDEWSGRSDIGRQSYSARRVEEASPSSSPPRPIPSKPTTARNLRNKTPLEKIREQGQFLAADHLRDERAVESASRGVSSDEFITKSPTYAKVKGILSARRGSLSGASGSESLAAVREEIGD